MLSLLGYTKMLQPMHFLKKTGLWCKTDKEQQLIRGGDVGVYVRDGAAELFKYSDVEITDTEF